MLVVVVLAAVADSLKYAQNQMCPCFTLGVSVKICHVVHFHECCRLRLNKLYTRVLRIWLYYNLIVNCNFSEACVAVTFSISLDASDTSY